MTTDRLALARVFEDAGIERNKAEAVASAVFDAIHDNVATKQDIAAVRADLAEFKVATKSDLRELELRLEKRIDQVVVRLGALVVVVAGLLFAALHYWHGP